MSDANIKLAFMTWVTPEWPVDEIIGAAHKYGYQGVEIRVESGQAHGIEKDTPEEALKAASLRFREAGIEICAVATSCSFAFKESSEREKQVADLLAYINMAHSIGCGRVRVFGGQIPDGVEPAGAVDWVADSLSDALEAAEEKRVHILLETHDSFSHTQYVREVMRQLYSDYAGVLWDFLHPLRHLEDVEESFDNIAPYVRHCHVHDMTYSDDRTEMVWAQPGTGVVPSADAVRLLARNGFNGYLSVEVIKGGDPDAILSSYANVFKGYIADAVAVKEDAGVDNAAPGDGA
ncbi:MAG: sugar phosphate isomerase/epimerase [Planctomycetes bacterium]|nr:sugar phosphate isomerase/epimerase [Planctomycetota bacterium]